MHSACPSLTTKIYVLRCMRRFGSTSTLKRKDQSLSLTVNYTSLLNTMFEQNRKEVKVGWRKLLDMGLHKLYRSFTYLLIIHPYSYICNTGLVQLYITKNYNTYTTSQTVTVISYPYRVVKQQFPCTVQPNAHSKIH